EQHSPNECPICNSWYSVTDEKLRVRSLGCGHSMCTSCLQRIHQRNSVTCPTCRFVHKTVSVDRIPICFAMESVIQSRDLYEGSPILNGGLCQKHATMKLFYCDTCKMFICAHCTILDHPRGDKHTIIDIKAEFSKNKSCNASSVDDEIKNLQYVQNICKDRLQILDDERIIHISLLQSFTNVMSKFQEKVADIDAQHAMQTVLIQEVQQEMNQLSIVKQQIIITQTLKQLSDAEQDCYNSLREARDWINRNKNSQEFSQLQIRSKATATSGRHALTIFDAANEENGRNGMLVLHMSKKELKDQMDAGALFATRLNNGVLKIAKLKFHNGEIHVPQLVTPGHNGVWRPPTNSIVLPYSAVKAASESSDFIIKCKDKGSCDCGVFMSLFS
ncbi:unnamed protein product, partial [Meganyctiphanes norvegica]